jgi:hypothetical protein
MAELPATDRVAALREVIERDLEELWGPARRVQLAERVGDLARAIVLVERSAAETVRTDFFLPAHE